MDFLGTGDLCADSSQVLGVRLACIWGLVWRGLLRVGGIWLGLLALDWHWGVLTAVCTLTVTLKGQALCASNTRTNITTLNETSHCM